MKRIIFSAFLLIIGLSLFACDKTVNVNLDAQFATVEDKILEFYAHGLTYELPVTVELNGVQVPVAWQSSNSAAFNINAAGTVTVVNETADNILITLTVTIEHESRDFTTTILGRDFELEAAMMSLVNAVQTEYVHLQTASLPVEVTIHGMILAVEWTSSNPSVISVNNDTGVLTIIGQTEKVYLFLSFSFVAFPAPVPIPTSVAARNIDIEDALGVLSAAVRLEYAGGSARLPIQSMGFAVTWTSDHPAITITDAIFNNQVVITIDFIEVNTTVNLTATIEGYSQSFVTRVVATPAPTLATLDELRAAPNNELLTFVGIVVETLVSSSVPWVIQAPDNQGGIGLWNVPTDLAEMLVPGYKVSITGRKGISFGIHQLSPVTDVVILQTGNNIVTSTLTTVAEINDVANQNMIVDMEVILLNDLPPHTQTPWSNNAVTLSVVAFTGGAAFNVRVNVGAHAQFTSTLTAGTILQLTRMTLGSFSEVPQLAARHADQIVIGGMATADQLRNILLEIYEAFLPQPDAFVTMNIALPTTAGLGSTFAWTSSNPDVISNDGLVVRPSTNTTVTLTWNLLVGIDVVVNGEIEFTVLAEAGPVTYYEFDFSTLALATGYTNASADFTLAESATLDGFNFRRTGTAINAQAISGVSAPSGIVLSLRDTRPVASIETRFATENLSVIEFDFRTWFGAGAAWSNINEFLIQVSTDGVNWTTDANIFAQISAMDNPSAVTDVNTFVHTLAAPGNYYVRIIAMGTATTNGFGADGNTVNNNWRVTISRLILTPDAGGEVIPVVSLELFGAQTGFTTQTVQLAVNVLPAVASNQNVTWSSSDDSLATVNASGLVSLVAPGVVTITVTSVSNPEVTATRNITISVMPALTALSDLITADIAVNTIVRIQGRISFNVGDAFGNFFITDDAGVSMFIRPNFVAGDRPALVEFLAGQEGSLIEVIGPKDWFNGLVRVAPTNLANLRIIETGPILTPVVVASVDEAVANISGLVTITGVVSNVEITSNRLLFNVTVGEVTFLARAEVAAAGMWDGIVANGDNVTVTAVIGYFLAGQTSGVRATDPAGLQFGFWTTSQIVKN